MPEIVTMHRPEIERICRDNGVRRLDLFGSGATGGHMDGRSDLDFYVDLGEYDRAVGRRYARLVVGLMQLFGDDIDVLTTRSVKKEWLRDEIERTRRRLYEA